MKEKDGEHPFGDAGQLIALGVFLVVWVVDSFVLHWTTLLAGHVPLVIRLVVTAVCLACGVLLARSGHVVVSGNERPTTVVDWGAFGYVRHPLYLSSLLFYFALAVATASLASFVLFLLIFAFYNYIAGYEERLMVSKFGDAYRDYMKRTGKWVPRIGAA